MGLSRCFPQAVPVGLGGEARLASSLRLRDLARLEAWAIARLGPPDEGLSADSSEEDLKAAYDEAMEWPPTLGTPPVDQLVFGTVEGRALILQLATRDDPRRLDVEAGIELARRASAEEWSAFERVAFEIESGPFLRISRLIDERCGIEPFLAAKDGDGKTVSWEAAIRAACDGDISRLVAIAELTIGQWRMLGHSDDDEAPCDPLPADPALEDAVAEARGRFWGRPSPSPSADETEADVE